jgi:adenylate cyclase
MSAIRDGRIEEASAHFARAVQASSGIGHLHMYHAAALALTGRVEEARLIARRGRELEPGWRIRALSEIGLVPEIADKLIEGAQLLGLPE